MSAYQQELAERYQSSKLAKERSHEEIESEDEDYLLELLDESELETGYRESRVQQLSEHMRNIDQNIRENGKDTGNIRLVDHERRLMDLVTDSEFCVVHFYKADFPKCKLMNKKLAQIAEKYLNIKVFVIDAEKAPYLVARMDVKILPFVVLYRNNIEKARLIGFEHLGGTTQDFPVENLERFLYNRGMIPQQATNEYQARRPQKLNLESDDELDL